MSRRLKLDLDMGNDAFAGDGMASELARLLPGIARRAAMGDLVGDLHDVNGNGVGSWWIEGEEEDEAAWLWVLVHGHEPGEPATAPYADLHEAKRDLAAFSEEDLADEAEEVGASPEDHKAARAGSDPFYILRPVDESGNFLGSRKDWILGPY